MMTTMMMMMMMMMMYYSRKCLPAGDNLVFFCLCGVLEGALLFPYLLFFYTNLDD